MLKCFFKFSKDENNNICYSCEISYVYKQTPDFVISYFFIPIFCFLNYVSSPFKCAPVKFLVPLIVH